MPIHSLKDGTKHQKWNQNKAAQPGEGKLNTGNVSAKKTCKKAYPRSQVNVWMVNFHLDPFGRILAWFLIDFHWWTHGKCHIHIYKPNGPNDPPSDWKKTLWKRGFRQGKANRGHLQVPGFFSIYVFRSLPIFVVFRHSGRSASCLNGLDSWSSSRSSLAM